MVQDRARQVHASRRVLRRFHPRPDDDRGAIALLVAAMLTVIVGLAAIVVDGGIAADNQRQAQSAADASSLAAAVSLTTGTSLADADSAARQYAQVNYNVGPGEWNGCTVALPADYAPMNGTPCIAYSANSKTVRITLPPRQIASVFSGLFGVSRRTVVSSSAATYATPNGDNCSLCVLDLIDSNTGSVQATGDIYVANARFNNAQGEVRAAGGDILFSGTLTNGTYSSTPVKVPALPDPYGNIPQPSIDIARPAIAGSGRCTPTDYYTDIRGCTSFSPGLYVLVGGTTHQINVTASDVMFFLTCSTTTGRGNNTVTTARWCNTNGEKGANFGGAGNSRVSVTGLQNDPTYKDFAVWVDRNNTTEQEWVGNGELEVRGIMYSANAVGGVTDKGNGLNDIIGRMVVGKLSLDGQGVRKYHVDVVGTLTGGGGTTTLVPRLVR